MDKRLLVGIVVGTTMVVLVTWGNISLSIAWWGELYPETIVFTILLDLLVFSMSLVASAFIIKEQEGTK